MNTKNLLAVLALVVVVIAGGGYVYASNNKNQEAAVAQAPTPSTPVDTTVVPTVTAPVALKYKDGTYTAIGEYHAPSGSESINVSLTIKDDVISDATVTGTAKNPASKMNQDKFISGYKALVVGKKVDDVNLSNVSGSSLTPMGFNTALEQIKTEAKA
jgi:uncharacterized protein with FMN-binding domain